MLDGILFVEALWEGRKAIGGNVRILFAVFITKHSILSDNLWQVTVFYMPCPFKRENI